MFLRRSATLKYFGFFLFGAVLYCEWIVYVIQRIYWNHIDCNPADPSCTKILLVADPQIQGDFAVDFPLNYLYNWDSDRYVKATFAVAIQHFKPDVLVYLGDLMDEGSVANKKQYHAYVKRLFNIFDIDYPVVQVWLPGDNDIGGENEPIKKDKIIEFSKVFDQPDIITFRNISIYKINKITRILPQIPPGLENDSNFKIVASHYPVSGKNIFMDMVNNQFHPDVFFCAHEHVSKYIVQGKDFSYQNVKPLNYGDNVLNIKFNQNEVYEIFVPTCSYRMGTSNIGFGAAVLENNNEKMRYTVLWSPTRFSTLYFYLTVLGFVSLYCLIFCIAKPLFRTSKLTGKSSVTLPLLDNM